MTFPQVYVLIYVYSKNPRLFYDFLKGIFRDNKNY